MMPFILSLMRLVYLSNKIKHKERILKAAREKQLVTYTGPPHKTVSEFLNRNFVG